MPATTTTEVPKAPTAEDLEILSFAQTLELALVEVYGAALATGKLAEDVLPVVAAFRDHHLQHGQAYAGLAGKAALNTANAGLVDEYVPRVEAAADQAAVLTVLFDLENSAAGQLHRGPWPRSGGSTPRPPWPTSCPSSPATPSCSARPSVSTSTSTCRRSRTLRRASIPTSTPSARGEACGLQHRRPAPRAPRRTPGAGRGDGSHP